MEKKNGTEQAVERVREMEGILNRHREEIEAMKKALQTFKDSQREYQKLVKYYYSRHFQSDDRRWSRGELAELPSVEVLTEDAIWDLMGDSYELTLDMLELATTMIRKR